MTGLDRDLSAIRHWMSAFERPIIKKLTNLALASGNLFLSPDLFSPHELVSSGKWLLELYEKTLSQLGLSFEPEQKLVELYFDNCFTELSLSIKEDLLLFLSHSESNKTLDSIQGKFAPALREILVRVHLGAILVGESKWQKNEELYRKLVLEDRDEGLVEHVTSKSIEDELIKRLEELCGNSGSSLSSLVSSFFIQTIVKYTKLGQCAFIRLHV